uniref:Uncharacterized protein n=1 Tax=Anopheles merus TaxID=30066 RepID=A0A182V833_ANOME
MMTRATRIWVYIRSKLVVLQTAISAQDTIENAQNKTNKKPCLPNHDAWLEFIRIGLSSLVSACSVMAEYPSPIPDDSTVRFASMLMISCMRAPFVWASCVSIVVAIVVLPYTGTSCCLSPSGFHCFSLMSEMKLG